MESGWLGTKEFVCFQWIYHRLLLRFTQLSGNWSLDIERELEVFQNWITTAHCVVLHQIMRCCDPAIESFQSILGRGEGI